MMMFFILVPRCLDLAVPPSPLQTRQEALACLAQLAGNSSTIPYTFVSIRNTSVVNPEWLLKVDPDPTHVIKAYVKAVKHMNAAEPCTQCEDDF